MKFSIKAFLLALYFICCFSAPGTGQTHSAAKKWNEVLLEAIQHDVSRPTVHARNLFHTSIAMYDAWAAFDEQASTYLLGHNFRNYHCPFNGIARPENPKAAREEALSYAVYRLLSHRFQNSPGARRTQVQFDLLMDALGYDVTFTATDYSNGSAAALGNYIAEQLIEMGLRDGSNELNDYRNKYYTPVNSFMNPWSQFNEVVDPNRWQPLSMENMTGQGGQSLVTPPPFLSPEWGKVIPFALQQENLKIYQKRGYDYWVYHDPGPPPMLGANETIDGLDDYTWNFVQVPLWASLMDPADGEMIDISPAANGNITELPKSSQEYRDFYKLEDKNYLGKGYQINPITGQPYDPQFVPRGDFSRVLAEFWADGPNSETPPGHWYTILNYVSDHPLLNKKLGGEGPILSDLEWDIKAYLSLGGALHDAAVTAWGIKGYYDYARPVTAFKTMANKGQRSDPSLPNYHPEGLPLIDGYIELIKPGDSLARGDYYVNEIKIYSWRGPLSGSFSADYRYGAGWILANQWLPYQPFTFVTPPFAGYISGHSTFSRAAAEVLSLLTGDEYFPGGMSEFRAGRNEFLEFEKGPSVDLVLQWAKYKDASDQCSLSRIWGGIHPPVDDIPGRIIGQKIGAEAFQFAKKYFEGQVAPEAAPEIKTQLVLYPNPLTGYRILRVKPEPYIREGKIKIRDMMGAIRLEYTMIHNTDEVIELDLSGFAPGIYLVNLESSGFSATKKLMVR